MSKTARKSPLIRVARIIALTATIGLLYIFGTSILENVHLLYIRAQARNVVTLVNEHGGGGTGFLIRGKSGKRYIMTNQHICDSANGAPLIAFIRGDKYVVNPTKSYISNDLCAVEAPISTSSNFTVARSVVLGERVYVIGHPLLEPITVTQGELSNEVEITITMKMNVEPKDCSGPTYELIDLSNDLWAKLFGVMNVCNRRLEANGSTVNILPGNSGSPTVNIWGNVVGVVFAATGGGIHSYHVPLADLQNFISQL